MTGRRPAHLALILALLIAGLDVLLLRQRGGDEPAARPDVDRAQVETLDEQLARVAATVEQVRGLTFPSVPEATYLSPEELAERASGFVAAYADVDAELDGRILRTLAAVPPEYDLKEGLSDLLAEQVAGFYDPETGEMVVGVRDTERRLRPTEELFLAHELEHALADATLGLPEDPDGELTEDAALAQAALVEGDATLTMQEYIAVGFSVIDQLRFAGESVGTLQQLEVLQATPWYLRRALEFPYVEGLAFVTTLRDAGGWEAVDAAYDAPPTSTLQILFPDRYVAGQSAPSPPAGGTLAAPWEQRRRVAFGAADLLFLFEAPAGDPAQALEDPRGRAGDWAGGAVTLWTDGARDAVGVVLRDGGGAATPLCESVTAWYVRAFPDLSPAERAGNEVLAVDGPRQDAVVRCDADEVRLGIGPDLQVARGAAG